MGLNREMRGKRKEEANLEDVVSRESGISWSVLVVKKKIEI